MIYQNTDILLTVNTILLNYKKSFLDILILMILPNGSETASTILFFDQHYFFIRWWVEYPKLELYLVVICTI